MLVDLPPTKQRRYFHIWHEYDTGDLHSRYSDSETQRRLIPVGYFSEVNLDYVDMKVM